MKAKFKMIEYKEFISIEDAQSTLDLLKQNDVPYDFVKLIDVFIPSYVPDVRLTNFVLKIEEKDIEKVSQIISNIDETDIKSLPKDYYLYSFTDFELLNILKKKDEWGEIDFQLAKIILAERGTYITDDQIISWENKRIHELSETDKYGMWYVVAGYCFGIILGIVGVILGYVLKNSRREIPKKKFAYRFSKTVRIHGEVIMYLSITVLVFRAVVLIQNQLDKL